MWGADWWGFGCTVLMEPAALKGRPSSNARERGVGRRSSPVYGALLHSAAALAPRGLLVFDHSTKWNFLPVAGIFVQHPHFDYTTGQYPLLLICTRIR